MNASSLPLLGLAIAACGLASILFYLAAPRQQWRMRPLPGRPTRLTACLLLVLALALSALSGLHPATAVFFVLVLVMNLFWLLPVLAALAPRHQRRRP